MRLLASVLVVGTLTVVSLPCAAGEVCGEVAVRASAKSRQAELTLADLLLPGACAQLREAAAHVSLGVPARPGTVRVLDGRVVERLITQLASGELGGREGKKPGFTLQVPERIMIQRTGEIKSCAEIGRVVTSASSAMAIVPKGWRENLDCAAAREIPEDAPLELMKTSWNPVLRRWEFGLRCLRAQECVPFLVWAPEERRGTSGTGAFGTARAESGAAASATVSSAEARAQAWASGNGEQRVIKPGQTATLSWERGGIRIVLPVTCLEGGGVGQMVRVRFKNAPRIVLAEVLGNGMLRANL